MGKPRSSETVLIVTKVWSDDPATKRRSRHRTTPRRGSTSNNDAAPAMPIYRQGNPQDCSLLLDQTGRSGVVGLTAEH